MDTDEMYRGVRMTSPPMARRARAEGRIQTSMAPPSLLCTTYPAVRRIRLGSITGSDGITGSIRARQRAPGSWISAPSPHHLG
jgi:hypothetical protein